MNCCKTTPEKQVSDGIDKDIKRGRKKYDAEIKLLLLGMFSPHITAHLVFNYWKAKLSFVHVL